MGVPMIGCGCAVCRSSNPRNHRTRSSVLLQLPGGNLLIDTSPELRLQFVRENIPIAHAVVYTHYHADHLFGLDDVRTFPKVLGGPLPLYCAADVEKVIRHTFDYAFRPEDHVLAQGMLLPKLELRSITSAPFEALGQKVVPIPLIHGRFRVFGFRFGDVAYCTDVSTIPDESWPLLAGVRVLVIDALKPGDPHPAHMNLDQALDVVARVRPEQTYLTHMSHHMDYDELVGSLPKGVAPAYDGLRFDF
ncbi:Metal-dependent hydrolase of the beta-lactamase superfamily I [Fimbriiglobus ruber]|uniref:Metal-dependent hydrolase of the beta-lactamase superfamily I n=1 Tax=Fimbriiglobus ruber TaxID=1908690 RepID=A0A225ECB9_9BACT|nr:Metal-dependent hydrolase of the beta-lactamase superfamily I [Fimbriiglobus ruber]